MPKLCGDPMVEDEDDADLERLGVEDVLRDGRWYVVGFASDVEVGGRRRRAMRLRVGREGEHRRRVWGEHGR